ncbi:MAG TPA: hypothetical protein VNJ04_19775, partial [Gemmatimonadaceae bacterium]|nr:hypothetical protein [Gemmatimonadaceae bacterium]
PEIMYRALPGIVSDYQRTKTLQDQIDQLARTGQANQLVRQGAGMMGGAIAPQTVQVNYDDSDPEGAAKAIYMAMHPERYQR